MRVRRLRYEGEGGREGKGEGGWGNRERERGREGDGERMWAEKSKYLTPFSQIGSLRSDGMFVCVCVCVCVCLCVCVCFCVFL